MAKKNLKKGIFITFEGPEGCGKSTQSGLLAKFLKKEGFKVLHTFEPGGTYIGKKIREILLDPKNSDMDKFSELLLFEAARAQITSEVIKPALRKKYIVISDRFNDATRVYQSIAGGIDIKYIKAIERGFLGDLIPDLTILLDIGVKEGLRRSAHKGGHDRMEQKGLGYHNKVRAGYLKIFKNEPTRVKLVKTRTNFMDTQNIIRRVVLNAI